MSAALVVLIADPLSSVSVISVVSAGHGVIELTPIELPAATVLAEAFIEPTGRIAARPFERVQVAGDIDGEPVLPDRPRGHRGEPV